MGMRRFWGGGEGGGVEILTVEMFFFYYLFIYLSEDDGCEVLVGGGVLDSTLFLIFCFWRQLKVV